MTPGLLVLACAGEGGPTATGDTAAPVDGGSTDAGTTDAGTTDAGTTDAGTTDAGATDGGTTDTGSTDGIRFTLLDGTVVEGEVVAEVDHRLWWEASEQSTWAVFDPEGWAVYPDDRSLRFVSSLDLGGREAIDLGDRVRYLDLLDEQGVELDQMPIEGPALVIMGNEGYHLEEDGYGTFAWDLVQTDAAGVRYTGLGAENEDYRVWGEPVTLPVPGVVVEIVRDAPDNRPGAWPEGAVNNMVGVWVGGQHYLYLLHFQQGSIPASLQVGDALTAGALLGLVGNSGVTLEPHLHMTALYYDLAPVGAAGEVRTWSVPIEWTDTWQSADPAGPGTLHERLVPATGSWIDDEPVAPPT